ncbi:aminopeptidase P N-terminal domain-containing protein [Alkalinema sp. FACHB-956]|uniref:aminopeptidase P N-terminal domain-containing protein n=1 Tax=Alkalinema sp. FACHB-956 TaxID=2692768 RepID=UPI001686E631|nr:aminopeptidase P N-terminal domain-containing protein [Alkalinema sp. FACHB-956]MBD2326780.1 aminopeptidase P N-terminal domain-containing protein [Alkalinema sp. FACHB-956]
MHPEFRQRREQLLAKLGNGTAIFRSASHAVMHNDVEYNFRQDSTFYYFTGFNEADAVAVFAPHHEEHKYILFVQPKDRDKETWTGYRVGVEAAKEAYGADIAYPIAELDEHLPKYVEKADRLYYHLGRDNGFNNRILRLFQRFVGRYDRTGFGPLAIEDPLLLVSSLRLHKSDYEIELMRKAVEIAAEAHQLALDHRKPGLYEYELQAEMERLFRLRGGLGPAYPSIVASGENACILHYTENTRQMQDGDLLLIDAGCSYDYYNSDITRTFPVGDKFTEEQRILYELVLKAQLAAIEQVQPGNPWKQFHETAVRVITEGLLELGLLQGDLEEVIKEAKYKPFFMHGTGHWLGLDVHDIGGRKTGDNWYSFAPGQVITVEPGIYIRPDFQPAEGQPEVPDRWRGIGIRIEDDVLVTATGNEILTAAVPKSVEAMER